MPRHNQDTEPEPSIRIIVPFKKGTLEKARNLEGIGSTFLGSALIIVGKGVSGEEIVEALQRPPKTIVEYLLDQQTPLSVLRFRTGLKNATLRLESVGEFDATGRVPKSLHLILSDSNMGFEVNR